MRALKSAGKLSLTPEPLSSQPFDLGPSVAIDDVPFLLALYPPWADDHDVIFANPKAFSDFTWDAAYAYMAILTSHSQAIKSNHLLDGTKNLTAPWNAQSFHLFFRTLLVMSKRH
jgi:hypothetical protein